MTADKSQTLAEASPGAILDTDLRGLGYALDTRLYVTLVTVVKAGPAGDFACYQRPVVSSEINDTTYMDIARYGNKLTERDAEAIFGPDIERYGAYRI